MAESLHHIKTRHEHLPETLLCALKRHLPLSESDVETVIRIGGAYLQNRRCKDPGQRVHTGQWLAAYYRLPLQIPERTLGRDVVVHENPLYLVADKPSGIPTQGRRDMDVHAFYEQLKTKLSGYLGLHHRLDQGTSGLMVFTRDPKANKDMATLFQQRRMTKAYLAVAVGTWPSNDSELVVDQPLAADRQPGTTRQVIREGGKPAVTVFKRIACRESRVLLAAFPRTGRTHQIRVHLAHLNLPVWGDRFYGSHHKTPFCLHCHHLSWPEQGAIGSGCFFCPPPKAWWSACGEDLYQEFQSWWNTQTSGL